MFDNSDKCFIKISVEDQEAFLENQREKKKDKTIFFFFFFLFRWKMKENIDFFKIDFIFFFHLLISEDRFLSLLAPRFRL